MDGNKEKKEYRRTVRMTPTVQKHVEKQPGNGFNQQFENMVLYCMEKEPKLKKSIAEQEKRLKSLNERISKAQSLVHDIDRMKYQVESVIRTAETIAKNADHE